VESHRNWSITAHFNGDELVAVGPDWVSAAFNTSDSDGQELILAAARLMALIYSLDAGREKMQSPTIMLDMTSSPELRSLIGYAGDGVEVAPCDVQCATRGVAGPSGDFEGDLSKSRGGDGDGELILQLVSALETLCRTGVRSSIVSAALDAVRSRLAGDASQN
jgi:hypothetical protein